MSTDLERGILEAVDLIPGITQKDLMSGMAGTTSAKVAAAIEALQQRGVIVKDARGVVSRVQQDQW
ncbi:MAG TPA: winged helix-turn-helix domain-containing protein [Ktedonobacteraceae bacterium]